MTKLISRLSILIFAFGFILLSAQTQSTNDSPVTPFITVWDTTNPGMTGDNEIRIPGTGDFFYMWEETDNSENNGEGYGSGNQVIAFPSPGIYRVMIFPDDDNDTPFNRITFDASGDYAKIIEIDTWGDVKWSSFESAYFGAYNMNITAQELPDLSNVTNMDMAFAESGIYDVPNLNLWDVSNVTSMMATFAGADNFNQSLDGWDVSNVEMMAFMFADLFYFNQSLNSWDVSNVKDMEGMFYSTEFFNGNISDWDVSNVEVTFAMFAFAENFNRDISGWDVSSVEEMGGMFGDAYIFNQDISGWDVSNVNNMYSVFSFATSFNQDISGWDVSNVEDMTEIFLGAEAFNQNLANWKLNSMTNGSISFEDSGMSCENYSLTLKGWAENEQIASNVFLEAGGMQYSPEADEDRSFLISSKNWEITGDEEGNCSMSLTENHNENEIVIYPNPTQDILYIKGLKGNEQITIKDMLGRNISSPKSLNDSQTIDLSELKKGIYHVIITNNEGNQTSKKLLKR